MPEAFVNAEIISLLKDPVHPERNVVKADAQADSEGSARSTRRLLGEIRV